MEYVEFVLFVHTPHIFFYVCVHVYVCVFGEMCIIMSNPRGPVILIF